MREVAGMRALNDQQLAKVDGGFIGLVVAAVRGVVYLVQNPVTRPYVINAAKAAAFAAGAWLESRR